MSMIRSFIAIELTDDVKQALLRLQARLKAGPAARAARWVTPEGIHLTLKFLGDVPSEAIGRIEAGMRAACAVVAPFDLTLAHAGCFPNALRPRVLWVGLSGDVMPLAALHRQVEDEMAKLGFAAEGRAFQPHLTLARVRDEANATERAALSKAIAALQVDAVAMHVQELSLMRSELRREGAVYTRLVAVMLSRG